MFCFCESQNTVSHPCPENHIWLITFQSHRFSCSFVLVHDSRTCMDHLRSYSWYLHWREWENYVITSVCNMAGATIRTQHPLFPPFLPLLRQHIPELVQWLGKLSRWQRRPSWVGKNETDSWHAQFFSITKRFQGCWWLKWRRFWPWYRLRGRWGEVKRQLMHYHRDSWEVPMGVQMTGFGGLGPFSTTTILHVILVPQYPWHSFCVFYKHYS